MPLQDLPRTLTPQAGVQGMQKPLRNVRSFGVGSVAFSKSSSKLPRLFHYLPFYKIFMGVYCLAFGIHFYPSSLNKT